MSTAQLTPPRWPDRAFRFDNPPWMLADFIERLRGNIHRTGPLLARVPDPLLRAQPDGTWSLLQNAGHLGDVEELWLQRIEELKAGRPVLTPADGAHFSALAEVHQERSAEEVLEYLAHRRAALVRALEGADDTLQRAAALHERLKVNMRLVDMAQFAAEHDDHHLVRMRELRRMLAITPA